MSKEILEEINNLIKKLDGITNNSGQKIFDVFCDNFLDSNDKAGLKANDLELFKMYIKDELGITLANDKQDPKYSLSKIPEQFLINRLSSGCLYNIKGLSKSLGNTELLKDVNITINHDDKIALIGMNGTGKSTLFKILAGIEPQDAGDIIGLKGLKIGYLSQDFYRKDENISLQQEMESTFPDITKDIKRLDEVGILMETDLEGIYDLIEEQANILERLSMNDGYKKYEMQTEILKYFGFFDYHLHLPINQLSGGEKTKVQIAKFVLQDVDLLLLDEPTNHLDIEGIVFLEEFLKKRKKAILCISHDKRFINSIFDKIWEISDGDITEYYGDYDDYMEQKINTMELQEKKYDEQTEFIKKQKEFINKNRARKSKGGAVKTRLKRLEKLERIKKPVDDKKIKKLSIDIKETIPQNIIKLSNVSIGYDNTELFKMDKELSVTRQDKIGVIGKNGVGKTTLLKVIIGELPPIQGVVEISEKIKIGYYSQVAEDLNFDNDILSELSGINNLNDGEIRKILASLLIFGDKVYQKISTLSGGERAKVALAKMIMQNPHVLIMDEPTNHLDIHSKTAISNMLMDFPGVAIIVSHDRDLLESISNKIRLIKNNELKVFDDVEGAFQNI